MPPCGRSRSWALQLSRQEVTNTLTFGTRLISLFFDRRPFQKGWGLRRHSLEASSSVSGIKPVYPPHPDCSTKKSYSRVFFSFSFFFFFFFFFFFWAKWWCYIHFGLQECEEGKRMYFNAVSALRHTVFHLNPWKCYEVCYLHIREQNRLRDDQTFYLGPCSQELPWPRFGQWFILILYNDTFPGSGFSTTVGIILATSWILRVIKMLK